MKLNLIKCVFLAVLLMSSIISDAQISLGAKLGFQGTCIRYSKLYDGVPLAGTPRMSLQAGGIYGYQINPLLSFYTEVYYSQKGKNLRSNLVESVVKHDQAIYHFLDMPLLLRFSFPIKRTHSKWHLNLGPHVAYWLGGKGKIKANEAFNSTFTYEASYQISFKRKEPASDYLNLPNASRLQFGLDFGGGVIFPIKRKNLMFDFRYTMGNTLMGKNEEIQIGNTSLTENLGFANQTFSVSTAYFIYMDMHKFRKGKSRSKRR